MVRNLFWLFHYGQCNFLNLSEIKDYLMLLIAEYFYLNKRITIKITLSTLQLLRGKWSAIFILLWYKSGQIKYILCWNKYKKEIYKRNISVSLNYVNDSFILTKLILLVLIHVLFTNSISWLINISGQQEPIVFFYSN